MERKKSKKRPWKMSFRRMPDAILAKINRLTRDDFVVACVKKIPVPDIEAGKYAHLGLVMKDGKPEFPSEQIPSARNGKYSRINANGVEIKLVDEPKVPKTYSFETPNWGDWSNGSHTVEWDRMIYRREWFAPKELALQIEILGEEFKTEKTYVIKFVVKEVLNRKSVRFRKSAQISNDLFFDLSLLQENVGAADIYPSDATRDDYLETVFVSWEILPPGEREETIAKILSGFKSSSPDIRKKLEARYDLLMKLKPEAFVSGTSGFRRYFGAKFSDSLVVFENLEYGNAIYAMFEEWETLSKRSRTELLNGKRAGFERIIHASGWKERLTALVKTKLRPAA
jgi:hypothetical protein